MNATQYLRLSLTILLLAATEPTAPVAAADAVKPPPSFSPLFNGQDLTGWRGGDTFDHRKLLAMPAAERQAQIAR